MQLVAFMQKTPRALYGSRAGGLITSAPAPNATATEQPHDEH